jgi:hypothetical protein
MLALCGYDSVIETVKIDLLKCYPFPRQRGKICDLVDKIPDMNKFRREAIELIEYLPHSLPANALPPEVGEMLWREYDEKGGKIRVEFPSPRTNDQWRLTAQGWVGAIPLTSNFNLDLKPKVNLGNLFRMWEYAYSLKSFHFLAGLIDATSLLEFVSWSGHARASTAPICLTLTHFHTYEAAWRPVLPGKIRRTWR